MEAVTAVQLTKTYGEVQAVRDLTLHVPQGGAFGLLGAQGAGKTTVIHMLCGLTKPTSGECSVLGCSPAKDPAAVHAVCGVMLASARPYAHMTGQQNLLFFAQAAGMLQLKAGLKGAVHKIGLNPAATAHGLGQQIGGIHAAGKA